MAPEETDEPLVAQVRALLLEAPPDYVAVYLFGSRARGTARADSDVDLGFWRATRGASTLDGQPYLYADELTRALGLPVQLVELNKAPCDLVHEVLLDGRLLLERDRDARVVFEVQARREYLDIREHLLRYRRLRTSA